MLARALRRAAPTVRTHARAFQATATPRQATKEPEGLVASFLEADKPQKFVKLYHYTTYLSLGLFPAALALSPSALCMPVDLAMGVVFPVHGHIGMNYIVSDYIPKDGRPAARALLALLTGGTVLGLLNLNVRGVGITETVKSMWRPTPAVEDK